ncbi:MAG: carbon storage regulator, partial [Bradyrhizobium sp.]|nr:carbon storage regulator [Bradyrhizobium sp.]
VIVRVDRVSGDDVKLSFDCPKTIRILREAVLRRAERIAKKACTPPTTE